MFSYLILPSVVCFPVSFQVSFHLLFSYHNLGCSLIKFLFFSLTDLVSGWVLSGFPGDELLSWMWIRSEALVLLRHTEKQTVLTPCQG